MDAKRDQNSVPTMLVLSSADGVTPKPVEINPSNHRLQVDNDTTGSDLSEDQAVRDNNGVPTLIAVSSVDGVTPVPLYADLSGKLLIKSV